MADLIQELMADERVRVRAMAVFRKFWKASPTYHTQLLTYITREEIWQMPEMYDVIRDAILNGDRAAAAVYAQWYPFRNMGGVVIGGQVQSVPSTAARFLDIAAARGRLDELARDVAAARKDRPDWTVGDFYLVMIDGRSGRYDDARDLVRKLADPKVKDENLMSSIYPMYAYSALGAELEALPALANEVPALYERAASLPYSMTFLRYGLDQHPTGRLIRLYERQGRMEDARRVALDLAHQQVPSTTAEASPSRSGSSRSARRRSALWHWATLPTRCRSTARRSPWPTRSARIHRRTSPTGCYCPGSSARAWSRSWAG